MTSWAGDGRVVETSASECPSCGAGWPLGKAGNVRVGWEPCRPCEHAVHGGHRTLCCMTCGVEHYSEPCDRLNGGRTIQRLTPAKPRHANTPPHTR